METVSDWSGLGSDLIIEIAGRLQLLEDFTALRGVCRPWRAAAGNIGFGSKSGSVPLLMLTERESPNPYSITKRKTLSLQEAKPKWKLYSITNRKTLSLQEAKPKWRFYVGFGWFIIYLVHDESREVVRLFHPFSGANIILPTTYVPTDRRCRPILSANPSHSSNFMLMRVYRGCLCVWRPGDPDWTSTPIRVEVKNYSILRSMSKSMASMDVKHYCYCNGKLHTIDYDGNVWILDHNEDHTSARFITTFPKDAVWGEPHETYLVGSSDGKLIYIARWAMHNGKHCKLYHIDVVKGECQEISGLDQDAVFIGHPSSICVRASQDIKPNCIYYTKGVYNIQDGSFEPFGAKSRCEVWVDCSNNFNTEKGYFERFNAKPRI